MEFNKHLKAWRVFRNLSQKELAERSGIARPNLVALEKGQRDCTLRSLEKLARGLDLSPGQILDSVPADFQSLDRHEIDRLCLAFFEDHVELPQKLMMLYQIFLSTLQPTLELLGIKKKKSPTAYYKINDLALSYLVPKALSQQIYRRVNKIAATKI